MIREEHLYDRGYLVEFEDNELALYRNPITYISGVGDIYHTIVEGETLYDIARYYTGMSSLWFIIADVNANIIPDIFNLPVNKTILIPNISLIQSRYG